ncbi:hypothetical protein [Paenibacillus sp. N3.4]|uniref:hypothetical protein n=1 Tax=Paenibacillus sp. N3.4 TaxID=2603222 RepID=UPI001C9CEA61|nr:hypothetical protein [Paenibacillus sp. N3.4]
MDTKQNVLMGIKEEVKNGRMKGIEIPLNSTFQTVVKVYGEPKGISNNECWTYSYDHSKINAMFYYDHDSCSNERNLLKPESILNQISVTPDFFHISITEEDVKNALGKPNKEYLNEAYGGYYLIYEISNSKLIFITEEESSAKKIGKINVEMKT